MSDVTDTLIDGLLEREADTGATIIIGGFSYPCSGGASKRGKTLDIGGFKPNADLAIVIRLSVFPEGSGPPLLKQTVTFVPGPNGTRTALRVDTATTLYDAIIVLECNDPHQAA